MADGCVLVLCMRITIYMHHAESAKWWMFIIAESEYFFQYIYVFAPPHSSENVTNSLEITDTL